MNTSRMRSDRERQRNVMNEKRLMECVENFNAIGNEKMNEERYDRERR